jgi:hypothetical protein
MKKNLSLFLIVILAAAMACNLPSSAPTETLPPDTQPADTPPGVVLPTDTPEEEQPVFEGTSVSYSWLDLVLPFGVADGAAGMDFTRAEGEDIPPWEITPGHIQVTLTGYAAQEKFHQPQIFVFPAQGYAEMVPGAAGSIQSVANINAGNSPIDAGELPHVPFFNAGQVFASRIERISFQNGQGVRFLTEYAQYYAPVNNEDLFYHFQGLTSDGAYYIIAILPVSAPLLAETNDPAAAVPPGGVVYPDPTDVDVDWEGYYNAVTALLDNAAPEAFAPTLDQLDLLIESILITS